MARAETIIRHPIEAVAHALHETPAWMGRHWKPLTLAVAALGGAGIAASQLARPYTPDTQVRSTVPVSDTFKPPEPPVGTGGGEPPPKPPEISVVAKNVVEQPVISPLEQAMQARRIELSEPKDWEKYFTPVSLEEASQLLNESQARGEFKFILPFNPQTNDVVIENYTYTNSAGMQFTRLGVILPPGRTFYSSDAGEVLFGQSGDNKEGKFVPMAYTTQISTPQMRMSIRVPLDIRPSSPFAEQKVTRSIGVNLGQDLFSSSASTITGANNGKYNADITIALGEGVEKLKAMGGVLFFTGSREELDKVRFLGADMSNLLLKDGRIAFVK